MLTETQRGKLKELATLLLHEQDAEKFLVLAKELSDLIDQYCSAEDAGRENRAEKTGKLRKAVK